jgi:hypothetical protein
MSPSRRRLHRTGPALREGQVERRGKRREYRLISIAVRDAGRSIREFGRHRCQPVHLDLKRSGICFRAVCDAQRGFVAEVNPPQELALDRLERGRDAACVQ